MVRDETWQRENARRLAVLAEYLRADLWGHLGISTPLDPAAVLPWLLPQLATQKREGDRRRLYVATALAEEAFRLQSAADEAEQVRALRDSRVLPLRRDGRRLYVETFAGRYLHGDPDAWPGLHEARKLQAPALLALAVLEVRRRTGASAEAALLFLLCDRACGVPSWAEINTGTGVTLWVYDALMSADALRAEYVALRRTFIPRGRPKRPQAHTLELIEFVREMRPRAGRHSDNASWAAVLERWNAEHPRERQYADAASISRAYVQTIKRRRDLGAPTGEEVS